MPSHRTPRRLGQQKQWFTSIFLFTLLVRQQQRVIACHRCHRTSGSDASDARRLLAVWTCAQGVASLHQWLQPPRPAVPVPAVPPRFARALRPHPAADLPTFGCGLAGAACSRRPRWRPTRGSTQYCGSCTLHARVHRRAWTDL